MQAVKVGNRIYQYMYNLDDEGNDEKLTYKLINHM